MVYDKIKARVKINEDSFYCDVNYASPKLDIYVVEVMYVEDISIEFMIEKVENETSKKLYPKNDELIMDFLLKKCNTNKDAMM